MVLAISISGKNKQGTTYSMQPRCCTLEKPKLAKLEQITNRLRRHKDVTLLVTHKKRSTHTESGIDVVVEDRGCDE